MNVTKWIIVSIVVLGAALDVVLAVMFGVDMTISVQLTKWSHEYPAIPFAFGLLMGHFFLQNQKGQAP